MLLQILVYCTIVLLARPVETVDEPLASWMVCLALGVFQWSIARSFQRSLLAEICWAATSLLMIWPGNWGGIIYASAWGEIPLLREAVLLLPAILSRLTMLSEAEGIPRALAEIRLSLPLTCGPVWLGSAAAHWGGLAGPTSDSGVWTIALIVIFLIAVYPEFLRRSWGLTPVDSPDLARRLQSQFGRSLPPLLVWPESIGITNAALLGCVPPFRYLVISASLLDTLTPRELEAVIAHEMGHLRLRHVARRLIAIVAAAAVVLGVRYWLSAWLAPQGLQQTLLEASAPCLLSAYYLWSTPRQSRRMELEADAWAAAHLRTIYGNQATPLLTAALRKLSVAANVPLEQAKWLHPSFYQREAALRQRSAAPGEPVVWESAL
ncbi:M48 family metallopeptidase [Blastopirellula sp. J2-11]|uniref:M48 family metallopeptidase n=1 Tax=Blastopirellula sp. J2-11 TaxID=2943192 RepID=UPI0021C7635C|nr:M48 family metallopeptidase [Blastopirellula sp. J2-11]UUO08204.1 M48 family metallopeptidase [Blastopirellula sp. J2-11]